MNKKTKDVMVVGFALFAMFLGAGNLIFPPTLGALAGDKWAATMFGFMMTGIGMPILGIITTSKAGGSIEDLGGKVSKQFAIILGFLIMLAIGPLLAIPRTAATTYEIAVKGVFPSASPILSAIVFFGLTLYFSLNQSGVVDKVGEILTPILLIILFLILAKGIFMPLGTPIHTGQEQNFGKGFQEGYQTMDALGSIIMAAIVIDNIRKRGYVEHKENLKLTCLAGVVAAVFLGIVYGGLVYIGATGSGIYPTSLTRVDLLMSVVQDLFGNFGKVALGLAVSLACLTTSVGLTATAGDFFSKHSNLSYKAIVIVVCLFSAFFAIRGVDQIIQFAVPILTILYPITIVIIVLNLFDSFIKYKMAYSGAVIGAFLVSFVQGISIVEPHINKFLAFITKATFSNITPVSVNFETSLNVIKRLPFSAEGFAWIVPALLLGIVFAILERSAVKRHKLDK